MARRVAAVALIGAAVLLVAGCGEGGRAPRLGGKAVAPPAVATTTPPRHTAPAPRSSAPQRASGSSPVRAGRPPWPGGDTTPPPNVVDGGNDYVAIWYSLDGFRIWLEQHHPDPKLIPRVWVRGGSLASAFENELSDLASHHARWIDINERFHVRVASVTDHQVTLLVDEQGDGDRAIDDAGHVILSRLQRRDAHYVVLMDRDAEGHWRLVSAATRITNDTEVHL
jgi:hypothetical protein